jgi:excisionase family DNA binding protein
MRIAMAERLLYPIKPDVLEATGLGQTTIYEEMKAGRLGYVKVGTRRLVPHAALIAYVELLKAESPSTADPLNAA